ncbi:hypothetical protein BBP00_00008160 [Phytophthora kernoviae]|uniref:Uncharacterized protein n=1 Tax=Phytophthora kernoviae TaxID=325452 RepID=A0A3F2RGM1_9STRA|nr:hypothetical protein BBP00_00008160 [Phytophthora kernoviae]
MPACCLAQDSANASSPTVHPSIFREKFSILLRTYLLLLHKQARASLKNPSRPFTPQSSARPLFHGDDYRPGSRPSSSYTVAEQKEVDELEQSYSEIKRCVNETIAQIASTDVAAGVERLRELVDSFAGLSSFFQGGGKYTLEDTAASKLRLKLFDLLSNVLLEKWSSRAACVLELAPALLNFYCAISTGNGSDKANSLVVKLGKTLFVLSKNSSNDECFCHVRYIEAVLRAIAETSIQASVRLEDGGKGLKDDEKSVIALVHSPDREVFPMKMLIYAAGTLKNISNAEDKMTRLLATNRAIAILSETMLWRADNAGKNKEIAQFLIQTTGILRNLSIAKTYHKQFLEARIPLRLCSMIPAFLPHQELMVNISRILSKLTLHELPRAQINTCSTNMQHLMALVDHRQNPWLSLGDQQNSEMRFQDLLFIRVFFVLGNLTIFGRTRYI